MITEELVRQIVTEVINQEIFTNFWFYLIIFFVVFLSTSIRSFVMPYLKKRGEQYATKSDFDEIIEQLEKTTKTTAKINSQVTNLYQHQLDMKHVKREKLEELFRLDIEVIEYLKQFGISAFRDDIKLDSPSPISSMKVIQQLYFKDVDKKFEEYEKYHNDLYKFISNFNHDKVPSNPNKSKMDFVDLLNGIHKSSGNLRTTLLEKYSEKLGVD